MRAWGPAGPSLHAPPACSILRPLCTGARDPPNPAPVARRFLREDVPRQLQMWEAAPESDAPASAEAALSSLAELLAARVPRVALEQFVLPRQEEIAQDRCGA